jgi:hypothetical protein
MMPVSPSFLDKRLKVERKDLDAGKGEGDAGA